jgi:hypothetical protein
MSDNPLMRVGHPSWRDAVDPNSLDPRNVMDLDASDNPPMRVGHPSWRDAVDPNSLDPRNATARRSRSTTTRRRHRINGCWPIRV